MVLWLYCLCIGIYFGFGEAIAMEISAIQDAVRDTALLQFYLKATGLRDNIGNAFT
jgi:hypothetical protein